VWDAVTIISISRCAVISTRSFESEGTTLLTEELPWLTGADLEWVRLGWPLPTA